MFSRVSYRMAAKSGTEVPLEDGNQGSYKRKVENPNSGLCERELAKPVINLQSSWASKKIQSTKLGKIHC